MSFFGRPASCPSSGLCSQVTRILLFFWHLLLSLFPLLVFFNLPLIFFILISLPVFPLLRFSTLPHDYGLNSIWDGFDLPTSSSCEPFCPTISVPGRIQFSYRRRGRWWGGKWVFPGTSRPPLFHHVVSCASLPLQFFGTENFVNVMQAALWRLWPVGEVGQRGIQVKVLRGRKTGGRRAVGVKQRGLVVVQLPVV